MFFNKIDLSVLINALIPIVRVRIEDGLPHFFGKVSWIAEKNELIMRSFSSLDNDFISSSILYRVVKPSTSAA